MLSEWSDFYVIVGGAAAALTGLQFVVIVLSAELEMGTAETTSVFATPTIVHFCAVLLVAATMAAPWSVLTGAAILLGITGAVGAGYIVSTIRTAARQQTYRPVLEDWFAHFILPIAAYALLIVAAVLLTKDGPLALFLVAATTLLLLFVGIHNAWDSVTYVAHEARNRKNRGE